MKRTATFFPLLLMLMLAFASQAQITVTAQVSASSDDAEEQGSNGTTPGAMDLTSTDLELVNDGNDGDQWVGMRFNGLNIPQGVYITSAYIQFTVDEDDTLSGDKFIYAEDVDNASAFASTASNISTRTLTNASTMWSNLPLWSTIGAAGVDQQTPNIANVVQEIVNRTGWSSGNSMNIIMNGTGERVAESYDGSPGSAPILVVNYLPVSQISYQVSAGSDDAEEQGSNGTTPGAMDLTSSDLELVRDGNDGDQFVGMRFNNINVPQGGFIASAYIQFTVDEDDTLSGDKFIFAEDEDNAATFAATSGNISGRTLTADSVIWSNLPTWPVVGAAGVDQRTVDIGSLIQTIVNRPGWLAGNSLNIIMTGSGERVAESFDGSPSDAPQLIINYAAATAPLGSFPIDSGTVWAYHDSGFALSPSWIDTNYNDTSWTFGPAQLGYGDGDEATVIDFGPNANDKYPTYYFRQRFEALNASQWDSLRFNIKYDDGAIVYLNGTEVFRVNMPTGAVAYTTLANSAITGAQENQFTEFVVLNTMVEGINTVAVEVHQNAVTSSDLTFDLMLDGILPPLAVDTFPLASGGSWYFLDNGTDQDTAWREFSFDPFVEGWAQGDAQLGYGDGDESTIVSFGPNSNDKYITTYFYKEFFIDTTGLGDSLLISLLRDDGAAVYLNGNRVVLDNMPATYDFSTFSSTTVSGVAESVFYGFPVAKTEFNQGLNTIAVEVHQRDGFSSDLSFDLSLNVIPDAPIAGSGCTNGVLNHIGCFTSVDAIGQTQFLTIPESHAFQVIFQQGEIYDNTGTAAPGNNDFTGYVPINGSSVQGYVDVNHETTPGGVTVLDVHYDEVNRVWITDSINQVDMYNSSQVTTTRNCSGGVTPWETSITSEETFNTGDLNSDGYEDVGWNVEIDPATRQVVGQTKLWAMGRMAHENVVVADDSIHVYQGEDGGSSCVFKYVADNAGDLSSGALYVLKMTDAVVGGEPTGTTGDWIQVPNTTQSDRNNTRSLATALGGTWFNGVEDCEIHPLTGQIYFTSKGHGRVYRFSDDGATVSNFETFVGGATYAINIGGTVINEPWAGGNDNLDFDELGNLWVNQDGSDDYIWMVRPDHSQANPKVELFASTPNGSESTGITFTPDHKFMFVSIQHPSGSNGTFQDVTGDTFAFNVSTTIVVARKEYLGAYGPVAQSSLAQVENPANCEQVDVNWTSGDGTHRIVVAKEGSAVDALPLDGMMYNADASFGSGDDLGGGNFVIYDGTGSSVQVDGIDDQDEYFFAVFEYTEQFGSYFYNTASPATSSFEFDPATAETIAGIDSALIGTAEVYDVAGTSGYSYDWSVTGGTIASGQSTNSITVDWSSLGTQSVALVQTTDQGCEDEEINYSVVVSDTVNGINPVNGEVIYSIYPNPTSGLTTIQFTQQRNAQLSLVNMSGASVNVRFESRDNQVQFDASNLPSGVYFLQIVLETGAVKSHQIIVK